MHEKKKLNVIHDADVIRLNYVGIGLQNIADKLGCHSVTIGKRLRDNGIEPYDTRRSFMNKVFENLSEDEQDLLSHYLFNEQIPVDEYLSNLIRENLRGIDTSPIPAPQPELQVMKQPESESDLVEVPEEIVAEAAELPKISPEIVEEDLVDELVKMCLSCGEAPEITGLSVCPGCLDEGVEPQTGT